MAKITKFDNGLTLVSEYNDRLRSVTVGFWVGTGSAYETAENNGISHFTEHVTFKGTDKYSPFEIAKLFEDYGANINAFTGKEGTCYYFKCIDENLEKCFSLLAQIFYESTYPYDELEKERKVILEEINMSYDDPEDICFDKLAEVAYRGTPLAMSILGPSENVSRFTGDDVRQYCSQKYTADNTVISVVGNVEHEKIIDLLSKYVLPECNNNKCIKKPVVPYDGGGFAKYEKDFEQINLALAFPTLRYNHPLASAQNVLSFCLGSGMSSRLFQVLREERGLVYNVYSSCSYYTNCGSFYVYVNTGGKNLKDAVCAVKSEILRVISEGITVEELSRAKLQLKSNAVFAMENTLNVVNALGKYALLTGELYDENERLKLLDAVTLGSVKNFCEEYFDFSKISVACVGKKEYIGKMNIYDDLNNNC